MEELGLQALHRRVAGIDVHRMSMLHVVTVLIEQKARPDPSLAQTPHLLTRDPSLADPSLARRNTWVNNTKTIP